MNKCIEKFTEFKEKLKSPSSEVKKPIERSRDGLVNVDLDYARSIKK